MKDWKEIKLENLGEIITGKTPSRRNPEDWGNEMLFITPTDYGGYRKFAYFSNRNLSRKGIKRLKNKVLPKNSILVTCIGSQMGLVVMNKKKAITNQQINSIIPKSEIADHNFLYYTLKGMQSRLRVLASGGTAVPILNKGDFEKIKILLPPLPEQRAIAAVLSSLDDKIDLLHRQNETLEAMAETLFREWFIEQADEDWEEGTLGDEFEIIMGQSPPGSSYNEEGIGTPMYQGNRDFGFRFPTNRVFTVQPKRFAQKYDTLISVRAPVGAQNMANEVCCIGRGVSAFRYKNDPGNYTYTFYKLKSLMNEIKQYNQTGTVFGSISKTDFQQMKVLVPKEEDIQVFQNIAKPIDKRINNNSEQIRTLTQLRDTLLPKLMSGEIRVKETEVITD